MSEEKGIKETLEDINKKLEELPKKKDKKKIFKLPSKAKVNKANLKKGYVTIEVIGENKEVFFTKEPIIDGTVKIGDTVHAVDELDIFTYKGRPFVHQPKTKINPWNPLTTYLNEERISDGKKVNKNEIYGQKYVMSRMKNDMVSSKKPVGAWIWIVLVAIAGIVVYAFIKG